MAQVSLPGTGSRAGEAPRRPGGGPPAHGSARAAAVLFGALAAFEVALAAGLPWGRAAWGGGQAELDPRMRAASGAAAVVLTGGALVVLRHGGHRVWSPLPQRWLHAAVWGLTAYCAAGTLMNAISRSPVERAVMTPTALALSVLCATVARRGSASRPAP